MMNVQSDEVTKHRMNLYRQTLAETGYDEAKIAQNVSDSWVWRNVFVAETDEEAERVGVPAFTRQHEFRSEMRKRSMKNKACACRKKRKALPGTIRRMVLSTDRPRRWPNASPRSTQLASAAS